MRVFGKQLVLNKYVWSECIMLKECDNMFSIYTNKKKNPKFTNILGTGQLEENEEPAK